MRQFLAACLLAVTLGASMAWALDPPPPKPAPGEESPVAEASSSNPMGTTDALHPADNPSPIEKKDTFILATGPVSGAYFPAGGALQHVLRLKGPEDVHLWIESTEGSLDNLNALKDKKVDLAIVQSDWQYHAWKGTGGFKNAGPFADLRAVLALYSEPLTLLTRVGSEIATMEDMEGKTVSLGPSGSSIRGLAELVLTAYGWDPAKDLKVIDMALSDQIDALCNGDVDVIAFAAAHPNGFLQEATNRCQMLILPIEGKPVNALIEKNPFIVRSSIPGGLYPNIDDTVPTVGLAATIVTSEAMPEDKVYEILHSIGDNMTAFKEQHPVLYAFDLKFMAHTGLTAPLHPGAARYYKEVGIRE